jgi:hypothetical protein
MERPLLTDIEDRTLAMADGDYVSFKTASAVLGAWYSRDVTHAELLAITGRLSRLGFIRWRIGNGHGIYFRNRLKWQGQGIFTAEFTATAGGIVQLEAPRYVA